DRFNRENGDVATYRKSGIMNLGAESKSNVTVTTPATGLDGRNVSLPCRATPEDENLRRSGWNRNI
ncbi:MAG TPA: hypothetical protein VE422_48275, partial [Terriglobia bacterium]|nr:hypothetical protein [Terriglobia bacterium]